MFLPQDVAKCSEYTVSNNNSVLINGKADCALIPLHEAGVDFYHCWQENPLQDHSHCAQTGARFLSNLGYRNIVKWKRINAPLSIRTLRLESLRADPVFPFRSPSTRLSAPREGVGLCTLSASHPPGLHVVTDNTAAHHSLSCSVFCSSLDFIFSHWCVCIYEALLPPPFSSDLSTVFQTANFFFRTGRMFTVVDSSQTPPQRLTGYLHDMIFWLC